MCSWSTTFTWSGSTSATPSSGMRLQNVAGSATAPVRVAHCTIEDTGHSGMSCAGWWQDIATSGGTPPAGGGNERGFSEFVILEGNTVRRVGRTASQFGEGFYLGVGSFPSWFGYAKNVVVRYNNVREYTADAIDVKPGCRTVYIHDNHFHDGASHFGATMGIHYIATGAPRPAWATHDPEIWCESNRVEDHNTSFPVASSAPWPAYHGVNGIRWAFNLFWTWDAGQEAVRIRCEEPETSYQSTGNVVADHFVCNTLWSGNGLVNAGFGSGTPVSNPPTQLNNIVATGEVRRAGSGGCGGVLWDGARGRRGRGCGLGERAGLRVPVGERARARVGFRPVSDDVPVRRPRHPRPGDQPVVAASGGVPDGRLGAVDPGHGVDVGFGFAPRGHIRPKDVAFNVGHGRGDVDEPDLPLCDAHRRARVLPGGEPLAAAWVNLPAPLLHEFDAEAERVARHECRFFLQAALLGSVDG